MGRTVCNTCQRSFGSQHGLNSHINDVHTFPCKYCPKVFQAQASRSQHVDDVHTWYCDSCPRSFRSEQSRDQHFNDVHSVNREVDYGAGRGQKLPPAAQGSIAQDETYGHPPTEDISQIVFANHSNKLACSSYDGEIRVYNESTQLIYKTKLQFGAALGCAWSTDDSSIFGFSALGTVERVTGGTCTQIIGRHADAVLTGKAFVSANLTILATGSLDKTIKYWDIANIQPPGAQLLNGLVLPEKAYAMDVKHKLLAVAMSNRKVAVVHLDMPAAIAKIFELEVFQLCSIVCFPDCSGFVVSSTQGRCVVQYLDETRLGDKTFSFECHRVYPKTMDGPALAFPVRAIAIHPDRHTLATAASDGRFIFWNKDTGHQPREFPSVGYSIVSASFSPDGMYFAYAMSYDWSWGPEGKPTVAVAAIKRHKVSDDDTKPGLIGWRSS